MKDFDLADGKRNKHFSKFLAKVRTHSCLQRSINKRGLQDHALQVVLPEFRQLQDPRISFSFLYTSWRT